jgi:hypothetical protein
LASFDDRTIEALRSSPSGAGRSALEKAKQGFSIGSETQGDDENDMKYEMHFHCDFFKLAVKDQLHIASI